jgi:hypothetical protein
MSVVWPWQLSRLLASMRHRVFTVASSSRLLRRRPRANGAPACALSTMDSAAAPTEVHRLSFLAWNARASEIDADHHADTAS